MGKRDIIRTEDHIVKYLRHPVYGSRNLHMRHLHQIDSYDNRVEEQLKASGFYYVSQIGRIVSHRPTVDALVERWRPKTHTFHLPYGECTITLEDVAMILGLQTDGLPVTGSTDHSTSGLENECLAQFGVASGPNDHKGSGIKLAWFRTLKRRQHLTDQFSWGSACLAHMYRSLCRASRYDCKDMDGPLALLLVWAWIRMPTIGPLPVDTSFPLTRRWNDYQPTTEHYKNWTTSDVRRRLDDLPLDGFVWDAYSPNRVAPQVIPFDINNGANLWSATD
ncbi:serine/threonine-protein phosphatase 7 long form homolog [Arachis ipaensis]|uniref:serine/threonine-protein phosphatase 7 long form homolog n=1 Tax=Arachis ipaensis TaxID=130454 RepID=UPI000A2B3C65|nr:serine/threonine-protein phosphatase 7 long form homolog [Arachis ipaensis]